MPWRSQTLVMWMLFRITNFRSTKVRTFRYNITWILTRASLIQLLLVSPQVHINFWYSNWYMSSCLCLLQLLNVYEIEVLLLPIDSSHNERLSEWNGQRIHKLLARLGKFYAHWCFVSFPSSRVVIYLLEHVGGRDPLLFPLKKRISGTFYVGKTKIKFFIPRCGWFRF